MLVMSHVDYLIQVYKILKTLIKCKDGGYKHLKQEHIRNDDINSYMIAT